MKKVIGVGFKDVGKIYYFNPEPFKLSIGKMVVVETARGLELGKVLTDVVELNDPKIENDLKDVVRPASDRDIKQFQNNEKKAIEDTPIIKEIIASFDLDMKYIGCEYTLDSTKLLIYYTSDGRVDFRELVKVLAQRLHARIELRQIGPREAAKFLGGIGECGIELCCVKHLREFAQVSIKGAKIQNMNLASNKITGQCGKLLCCINYEESTYREAQERLPRVGDIVDTPDGRGKIVVSVDLLKETVTIKKDEESTSMFDAKDVKIVKRRHIEEKDDEKDS